MRADETDDTDFMAELAAARNLRPSLLSNLLLAVIAAFVVLFFVWASASEVEILTRGQGQVVPTREVQVVQSLEGGILQELLVSEGDLVKPGQVILRISDVQFSSEERGTEARFLSLAAKKARLQAEANGEAFSVPETIAAKIPNIAANEKALHESRQSELKNALLILDDKIEKGEAELAEINARINSFASGRRLLQEELDITRKMVAQKAAPKIDEIRLERELSDLSGQIRAASERRTGIEAELRAARNERKDQEDKFRSKALGELNEVETDIAALQESLKSIEDRVFRTEVRSPVAGVVNNIAVKTIGGVIEPAQRLVEIVPVDDDLKIVAKVSPNDIAFLDPGQPAKVKITAYNPQRYGSLDGKVVRIGATSVSDRDGNIFFEIEVRTDRNHLGTPDNPLPVTPGMVAQVDIITGKRTILEYLAKPVLQARDTVFRER
ncbi:MAG: HlyD family type I secretion periplasmic adaptor subunit [Alphaproteobacteria bacterium]|nr:HlyD family type I secretion periplasmic adaptor subunit [Alphaproteobacteria bacterium]